MTTGPGAGESAQPQGGRPRLDRAVVVGTGLMGTSVALALAASGTTVHLADRDPAAVALAVDLGAGTAAEPPEDPDLVVLAVPPASLATALAQLQLRFLDTTFTDLASVKSRPQAEIESLGIDSTRFVGGHPLAGRERSGAGAARADLFEGRPWVLTPHPMTTPAALLRAEELVRRCRADLVVMTPQRHDEAVALVSHAPQVLASLMAARLEHADPDLVGLAGQGVRDVTRIAASDPALWTEILAANAPYVRGVLDDVAGDLDAVRAALAAADSAAGAAALTGLLARGNAGRARLPGKHGSTPATYAVVPVVVPDRPGELGRIFAAAGDAGVNVEDVSIEHSPGQPVGLLELAVRPEAAPVLAEALRRRGWAVHP